MNNLFRILVEVYGFVLVTLSLVGVVETNHVEKMHGQLVGDNTYLYLGYVFVAGVFIIAAIRIFDAKK